MTELWSCNSLKPANNGQKTWSFRRSTIARRTVLMEPDIQELNAVPARRSGRRIKRTDKLLHFLSAAKRGRGARRQTSLCLEHSQPSYQLVTADAENASKPKSLEGHQAKVPEESSIRLASGRMAAKTTQFRCASGIGNSTDAEDSDELTLKELQDLLKKRKKDETKEATGPGSLVLPHELGSRQKEVHAGEVNSVQRAGGHVPRGVTVQTTLTKESSQSEMGGTPSRWRRRSKEEEEEYTEQEESSQSDPDAIYCTCRQKHNGRFMICCDRCQEWFHGDCVGIPEAEGRQLERNGEDYICPSCTSLTILPDDTSVQSASASAGISTIIIEPTLEITGLPKCIGPGCRKNALPDSVYCSSDCIVRHAAEAMKSLANMKEPRLRQKPGVKVQTKLAQASTSKDQKKPVHPRRMSHSEAFCKAEEEHGFCNSEEWAAVDWSVPSCFPEHNDYTVKLNKSTTSEGEHAEEEFKKVSVCTQNPFITGSQSPEGCRKLTPQGDAVTWGHWQSPGNSSDASKKCAPPPGVHWESLAAAAGDTPTSQLSASPPSHCPVSRVLSFSRATYTLPKQHLHLPFFHPQQLTNTEMPPSPVSATIAQPPSVSLGFPVQSQPLQTNVIRQNICRSLADILCKRVSDSDDLEIPESEIERLALSIEKEMFNVFLDTDRHYKNKYSSLMFSLKDPKNKSLLHGVVKGEVTPFLLVRLSSEQLLSIKRSGHEHGEEHKESYLSASADTLSMVGPASDAQCSLLKNPTTECRNNPSDYISTIWADQMPAAEEPNISKFSVSSAAQQLELIVKQDSWPSSKEGSSGQQASDIQAASNKPIISPKDICSPITASTLIMSSTAIIHPAPSSATSQELSPAGSLVTSTICTTGAIQSPNTPSPSSLSSFSQLNLPSLSHFNFDSSISMADSLKPQSRDTAQFLSDQQVLWIGSVNMHTVTKFAAKAFLVSGSFEYLEKNLPCSIQISGRISPSTVWDYVGRLKASLSKDFCLVRFYAAVGEAERAYVSLFSYFSSRGRFGVVANNNSHIKDLYIITLSAKDPIPSKLLPFEGPGLESSRPDLLLGLVICQKPKWSAVPSENKEKISRVKIIVSEEAALPAQHSIPRSDMRHGKAELLDTKVSCASSDSSACIRPPVSLQSSVLTSPPVTQLSSVKSPSDSSLCTDSPSSTSEISSSAPLHTVLNALLLKQKHDDNASYQGSVVKIPKPEVLLCDPLEQISGQICKGEENGDHDRPYDPEKDSGMDINEMKSNRDGVNEFAVNRSSDASAVTVSDVAFDPEDESIFEEVQKLTVDIAAQVKSSPDSRTASRSDCSMLIEKKKMLEKLNKEIALQKRQLEEQEETLRQERAAFGLSMAHFSVSDALLSPPSKSIQLNSRLVGLGENTGGLLSEYSAAPKIGSVISSKKRSDILHETSNTRLTSQSLQKEKASPQTNFSGAYRSETAIEPPSQEVCFLNTENAEVCNPLFQKKDPQVENDALQKHFIKPMKDGKNYSEDEMESNPYVSWENSTQILSALSPKSQTTSAFMPCTRSSQFPVITNCLGDNQDPLIPTVGLENHDFGTVWEMPQSMTLQPRMGQHKVQNESDHSGPPDIYPPIKNHLGDSRQQSNTVCVNRRIMGLRDKCEHADQRSPSQNIRQMDPHLRDATECQEPSQLFDGQKLSYQSRFKKLRSSVDYSRPSIPVHSVRTHQNNFGSRDPHFPHPRATSSSNCLMNHRPRKPLLDTPKDINERQYRNHNNVYESSTMSREACIYSQGFYNGPAHKMGDWGKGPVHDPFPHSQEMPSPQHKGSLRNYRGFHPSTFQVKVSTSSSQSSGPLDQPTNQFLDTTEQNQFQFQCQHLPLEGRPVRQSGPSLPPTPEYLLQIPNHNGQSSGFLYHGYYSRYSDVGRKGTFSNNSELGNNGIRLWRARGFQSGLHERESFKYSEGWRRDQCGFHSNAWATDLEMDKPGGPERYQKRDSRGRTKDDDMRREKYLRRHQEGDRDRDRSKQCDRDTEKKSRYRIHNQSRSRDRDCGKHFGHDRIREHRQDMKRERDLERDKDGVLQTKKKGRI